jgi:hypothetical protein
MSEKSLSSPYFTADELHEVPSDEAWACFARHFLPASRWSPLIRQLIENDFHEDFQVEVGYWLLMAERHRYIDALMGRVGRAEQDLAAGSAEDLFLVLLQELAPAMAAHYFLSRRAGWHLGAWEPSHARGANGEDVDLTLRSEQCQLLNVQVKAPDRPGRIVGQRIVDGERDEYLLAAIRKGVHQLPRPAKAPSLLVVTPSRNRPPRSFVLEALVGATTNYSRYGGDLRLDVNMRGPFFREDWAHLGGVAMLSYLRGVTDFRYLCIVLVNPNAVAEAALRPSWFPGARALYLEGGMFHWQGGAPSQSSFPDGTTLVAGPTYFQS